jgi:hypothetical protein
MLRTAFSDSATGSTWTIDWFCRFTHREPSVKDDEIQVIPLEVAQTEAGRKFAKLSVKTDKALFCRSLAGEASYIKHASEL